MAKANFKTVSFGISYDEEVGCIGVGSWLISSMKK
jgi:hypothetical protein